MKPGDVVMIDRGVLRGASVEILRRSKRTGTFTVKMLHKHGAYSPGDEVSVAPYECVPLPENPDE